MLSARGVRHLRSQAQAFGETARSAWDRAGEIASRAATVSRDAGRAAVHAPVQGAQAVGQAIGQKWQSRKQKPPSMARMLLTDRDYRNEVRDVARTESPRFKAVGQTGLAISTLAGAAASMAMGQSPISGGTAGFVAAYLWAQKGQGYVAAAAQVRADRATRMAAGRDPNERPPSIFGLENALAEERSARVQAEARITSLEEQLHGGGGGPEQGPTGPSQGPNGPTQGPSGPGQTQPVQGPNTPNQVQGQQQNRDASVRTDSASLDERLRQARERAGQQQGQQANAGSQGAGSRSDNANLDERINRVQQVSEQGQTNGAPAQQGQAPSQNSQGQPPREPGQTGSRDQPQQPGGTGQQSRQNGSRGEGERTTGDGRGSAGKHRRGNR
ncbi:MAG: hypothetical protein ACRDP4_15910, partial [Nocardioidaceae bacterium]